MLFSRMVAFLIFSYMYILFAGFLLLGHQGILFNHLPFNFQLRRRRL